MKKPAKTPDEILKEAKGVKEKETLAPHEQTIRTLREKKYSWREIAEFLRERGIDTDHSKVFRFIQKIEGIKMEAQTEFVVPLAAEYVQALKDIKPRITDIQWKMLKFHYEVRNRTATFGQIAKAVAPDFNYGVANLHYGNLGYALGTRLEMQFQPLDDNDPASKPFYSSAIGTATKPKHSELMLIMHHELAKALGELGWFEPKPTT